MLINPFPPGGAADVVGRPFAAALEPMLKQPVKIETKAGAAGAVGAQFAATAKPDGYTLLLHIVSISGFAEADRINGTPAEVHACDDFIPIARFTAGPMVLFTNDQTPYKSLKELVEDSKKNPDKLIFSSSGIYGALHLPTAAVPASGRNQDEASADQRRRAGADRDARQQLASPGVVGRGGERADEGRQGARARLLRRPSARLHAGRAHHEGARLRHRVLSVGWPVRAEGHASAGRRQAARRSRRRRSPAIAIQAGHRRISDTKSPISISPNSPSFWKPTPSASRARSARSASCNHDRSGRQMPGATADDPAQGPYRRRRVRRRRRARFLRSARSAVRHACVARRRHAADARRRVDDAVRADHVLQAAAGRTVAEISWSDLPHAACWCCRGSCRMALHAARLHRHAWRCCCSRWCTSSSGAASLAAARLQHRRFRSSPIGCSSYALKTPLERGLLWF